MRIGILTGGGDVPGLNACIKALVNRVPESDHQVIGIRRGWAGLLRWEVGDLEAQSKYIVPLDRKIVRRSIEQVELGFTALGPTR